jgi:OOP family OmpA-OmpF porin
VNFKVDSSQLSPEAMTALDQLASQIKDRNNFILEIQGFADAKGSDDYNVELTAKRAEAVRRYLAEKHNVSLYRMHMLGFGKVRPVADNATLEGRAQNRRVEIHLLTRHVGGGTPATTTSKTTTSNVNTSVKN